MRELLVPTLMAVATRGGAVNLFRKVPPPPPPEPSLIASAFASVYEQWFRLSSLVRFFVSGNLGNICFFFIERALYQFISTIDTIPDFVESYKDTLSFFVGYLLQIVSQHLLHAFLVYGLDTINTRKKYLNTLLCQFYAYGMALFGSTFLNLFLIRSGIDKTMAFFSTMVIFAIINYHLIGFLTERALKIAEPEPEEPKGLMRLAGRKRGPPEGKKQQRGPVAANKPRGNKQPPPRTSHKTIKNKKTETVRKIQRGGGGFGIGHTRQPTFVGLSSLHQMVLRLESVDVDAVNEDHQ